jgi:serine/threonine-protein kinase
VSPEQAECRDDIGEHTDVWSFSVVLYECVTGKVPFDSEDYPELFRMIGEDAPESILDHGVGDAALWDIIRRGLAKDPAKRWPTMELLGQALARWLSARGIREDITGVLFESKWSVSERSDVAAAPEGLEPSSFVRRIQRNPALATTQVAPLRHELRRYAIYAGAAVVAVVVLAFLLAGGESANPTVAPDRGTSRTPSTVLEPGVTIPAPAAENGPALAAPTARPHPVSHEASSHAVPAASGASPTGLEKTEGASTPVPEATASGSPSSSPPNEQSDELLNPY